MTNRKIQRIKSQAYAEYERRMSEVKEAFEKAGEEDGYYLDDKYVKIACNIAFDGVLLMLDAWIEINGKTHTLSRGQRKTIDYYRENISRNILLLNNFNTAYSVVFLSGVYDGLLHCRAIQSGLESFTDIAKIVIPEIQDTMATLEPTAQKDTHLTEAKVQKIKETAYADYERRMSEIKEALEKAGMEDGFYIDVKYTKKACSIAYDGVLLMLDAWIELNGKIFTLSRGQRKTIDYYRENISRNTELLNLLNSSYNILCVVGSYDGELKYTTIQIALSIFTDIAKSVNPEIQDTMATLERTAEKKTIKKEAPLTKAKVQKIKETAYAEYERRMSEIKEVLENAGDEDGFYIDVNYTKKACSIAYDGVLLMLDAWIELNGKTLTLSRGQRKTIDYYRENISRNAELLSLLNSSYNILCVVGSYYGELSCPTINDGLDKFTEIAQFVKP